MQTRPLVGLCAFAIAASATTAVSALPATAFSGWSTRVLAGPSWFTDSAGKSWMSRTGFVGADKYSNSLAWTDVKGTSDDTIYRTNAFGLEGWRTEVPSAGSYQVTIHAAEDWFTTGGQRVFDVTAEGQTKLGSVDIAASVGKAAAFTRSFTVDVTDYTLNLGFVAKTNYPLVSAIEVAYVGPAGGQSNAAPAPTPAPTPTPAPAAVTGSFAIPLAANSPWRTTVSNAPLASNSAALTSDLMRQVRNWSGREAAFNAYEYNTSFYKVDASTPRQDVQYGYCDGRPLYDGVYNQSAHFKNVPIPAGAVAAKGTDAHLAIYDASSDQLWEFWVMTKTGSGWKACWGGRLDNVSKGIGTFPYTWGTNASGTSGVAGMITIDEVRRGEINHTMSLQLQETAPWNTFSWPANRSDGTPGSTSQILMGQRLRLDPSVNVEALPLSKIGKMVARAAQKYGFLVDNRSGVVAVVPESGTPEQLRTGVNPWDSLMGVPAWEVMKGFPWDKMQFLPKDYGKP